MPDAIGGAIVILAALVILYGGGALAVLFMRSLKFLAEDPASPAVKVGALSAALGWYLLWLVFLRTGEPDQTLLADALLFAPFYSIVSGAVAVGILVGLFGPGKH